MITGLRLIRLLSEMRRERLDLPMTAEGRLITGGPYIQFLDSMDIDKATNVDVLLDGVTFCLPPRADPPGYGDDSGRCECCGGIKLT